MLRHFILMLGVWLISGCQNPPPDLFDQDNLVAWCIVPFDAAERSPEERAVMLDSLGFTMLAYDYREAHLPSFEKEIRVLAGHGIELRAVWFWVQGRGEDLLDPSNEFVLSTLRRTGTRIELWVSFPEDFFREDTDAGNLDRAVRAVREIRQRAEDAGCSVALYNHGGWFGEPENLVRIVESAGPDKLKIVYNFHHAHHRIDRFRDDLAQMLPYLSMINLNGMKKEGPKILALGEGDRELEMLRVVVESGYNGNLGILGHTEGEDIMPVLERNLEGLKRLRDKLNTDVPSGEPDAPSP